MTNLQIAAFVMNQLGNHPYITKADCYGWTNQAIQEMAKYVEGWDDYFTFSTATGQREYNLPSNLILLRDPLSVLGNKLIRITLEEAQNLYSNWWSILAPPPSIQDVPDRYYIRKVMVTNTPALGTNAKTFLTDPNAGPMVVGFYPTPNNVMQVDAFGTFIPGALVNDGDVPAFQSQWHQLIIDYDLWWANVKLMRTDMAAFHKTCFENGLLLMDHKSHTTPEYVQSGIPDLET